MGKAAAFGTIFNIGTRQVETATVIAAAGITLAGNARVIVTATTLVAESPVTTDVAVLLNDTADTVATKIIAGLNAVASLTDHFEIYGSGPTVVLKAKLAAADNVSVNIDIDNQTCTGLTDAPTSTGTTAGVAYVAVASVSNISGPGLSVDTVDVTTHDSTGGWEEVIATILRVGEVTLELVYDPNAATHSTATNGLLDRYQNKKLTRCQITFPGPYTWTFSGYITKFNPSANVTGALTATVTAKLTGAPTLV